MEKDHEIANLHDQVRNLCKVVEALDVQNVKLDQDFSNYKELSDKMISEKDLEKAKLNAKARGLDKDEEKLIGQIYIQCNENDPEKHDLKKYKNISDEII